jgi:hypothetical protein
MLYAPIPGITGQSGQTGQRGQGEAVWGRGPVCAQGDGQGFVGRRAGQDDGKLRLQNLEDVCTQWAAVCLISLESTLDDSCSLSSSPCLGRFATAEKGLEKSYD